MADTLSRPPSLAVALPATAWQEGKPEFLPGSPAAQPAVCAVPAFPDMLDFAAIADHQRSCQVTLQASKSSSLQPRAVEVMGASLLCDFSTGVPRPLIPVADRQKVFTTTCGGGRLYLLADHGGPHHQVAGGRPAAHHGGSDMRGRLH